MASTTPGALVLDADSGSSVTCVRSLGRRGIDTVVAAETDDAPAAASRYCEECALVPSANDELDAYRDRLLELARRPDIGTIIPGEPEHSYVLSKDADRFHDHVALPVPSMDQLRAVHDRVELAAVAADAGVPVPETRPLSAVEDWDDNLIIKSRYNILTADYVDTVPAGESVVVKDIHHLPPGERPDVSAIQAEMRHDPIVQEFIPKDGEYMVGALYDHGEPLAVFQHRQIRGNSYTGGGGVYRESISIPELERVATDLLSELEWHGLACIEYMRHEETGEFVLTEINPRMWQSLPSTVHAGADFPYYYWLQAMGRADDIDAGYEEGLGTHLLYGELNYLLSVLSEESPHVPTPSLAETLWEIGVSCLDDSHFDYLQRDDPAPFVRGFLNEVVGSD